VSSDVAREREREREREARRHLELGNSMKFGHTSSVSLCLFGLLREREREREKKKEFEEVQVGDRSRKSVKNK